MKKIVLGSLNPVKLAALNEVLPLFPIMGNPELSTHEASSGVSGQPLTIYETMLGAKNRAIDSYVRFKDENSILGIGIESGLIDIPIGNCGKADFCVCALFDGQKFLFGFSQMFVLPRVVETLVVNNGMDLNKAFYSLQLTDNPKIGNAEGMISLLSSGRITRQSYTVQALVAAFIQFEKPDLYVPATCF